MLSRFASSRSTASSTTTLPAVVLAHGSRNPDGDAIIVWHERKNVVAQLSWRQLSDCMISAATLLGSRGVVAGDRVAFFAHNSAAYVALSLGAMALGATSVNLNWRLADAVNQQLVGDLKPRVLIASAGFKAAAQKMHRALGVEMMLIESICADDVPFAPPSPAAVLARHGIEPGSGSCNDLDIRHFFPKTRKQFKDPPSKAAPIRNEKGVSSQSFWYL